MDTYYFVFTIAGFDQLGEEHRIKVSHNLVGDNLVYAVKSLVRFAARIMRCDLHGVAASKIILKSAWKITGKRRRLSTKELLEAMLKTGFMSVKGRGEQHLEKRHKESAPPPLPKNPQRRKRR